MSEVPVEVRVGLFIRAPFSICESFLRRGWLPINITNAGYYDDMLLWHCECGAVDPFEPIGINLLKEGNVKWPPPQAA